MKAISLWQPWASAMAVGLKRNETRHWPTSHRGPLAICSALRKPKAADISQELASVLWQHRGRFAGYHANIQDLLDSLPLGKVVCVVNLFECVATSDIRFNLAEEELFCGNYLAGRFAWCTTACKKLDIPVPVIGRQGFFNLPPDVEEKVRNQI